MKRFFSFWITLALAMMFAVGGSFSAAIAAELSRETILQAKKNDEAELHQWENRLSQLGLARVGNAAARRFLEYGKPGEDPTNAMRFASGPSEYDADYLECRQHILMLKNNIREYDKKLAELDKAEKDAATGDGVKAESMWGPTTIKEPVREGRGMLSADENKIPAWLNGSWSPRKSRQAYRITILNETTLLWESVFYSDHDGMKMSGRGTGVSIAFERPFTVDSSGVVHVSAVEPLERVSKLNGSIVKTGLAVVIKQRNNPWKDGKQAAQFTFIGGKNEARYKRTE